MNAIDRIENKLEEIRLTKLENKLKRELWRLQHPNFMFALSSIWVGLVNTITSIQDFAVEWVDSQDGRRFTQGGDDLL